MKVIIIIYYCWELLSTNYYQWESLPVGDRNGIWNQLKWLSRRDSIDEIYSRWDLLLIRSIINRNYHKWELLLPMGVINES